MNRNEITQPQLEWLKKERYDGDAEKLEEDLQRDLAYIFELLRFCPNSLFADTYVPPYRYRGFVESPLSSYDDEVLHTLERRQIPVEKILSTQWRVYSDVVNYYRDAYETGKNVAPLLVTYDKTTELYYVKDGHHRLYAHWLLRRGLVDVAVSNSGLVGRNTFYPIHEMREIDR